MRFRTDTQSIINFNELVIDNFAGGGGASMGIEMATGRQVDIAINHDIDAVRMHEVNHPHTRHYCESVWDVDPREVCQGRPVGLAWFSPDCKHHSKARGGKPVEKNIRGLAWVVRRWVATVKPRIVMLENVEEFQDWGPLAPTPEGDFYPCPKRKGRTFKNFVKMLKSYGYQVEWRELRACDYGTPTIRKRLFLVARCDGLPIVWPTPTHGDPESPEVKASKLKPWRTAAECIDWSVPCPSIFERKKPLAEATCRRIAKGVMRYVVNNPKPFVAPTGKPSFMVKNYTGVVGCDLRTPLATVTSVDHHSLVTAFMTKFNTGSVGFECDTPMHTITAGGKQARPGIAITQGVVTANLVHMGHGEGKGKTKRRSHGVRQVDQPLNTVTASGATAGLVTSHLVKLRNNQFGQSNTDPMPTLTAGGGHVGEVRAFLIKYYGTDQDPELNEPLHTITTKDRFGLVTVQGERYAIADIGLRMLTPRELFTAQGFPHDYVIEHDGQGKQFTKTAQVARCGNSVCPPLAAALVEANFVESKAAKAA